MKKQPPKQTPATTVRKTRIPRVAKQEHISDQQTTVVTEVIQLVEEHPTKSSVQLPIAKEYKPSDVDIKYMGSEPLFSIQPESSRSSVLGRCFNWYARFADRKLANRFLREYVSLTTDKKTSAQFDKVDDKSVVLTYGWLARLAQRGLILTEKEQSKLQEHISDLLYELDNKKSVRQSNTTIAIDKIDKQPHPDNKPNIQEIMLEKMNEAAGDLEGIFDEYLKGDLKAEPGTTVMSALTERNILPAHVSKVSDIWRKKIAEFTEVQTGLDKQLMEGYNKYSKPQIKQIIKFCESVISQIESYATAKRASRVVKPRKPQPVEKIVKNVKYLKSFVDERIPKLKLESLPPTKLHGASECFLYDTSKRKLIYLVSDEYSKTFSVKGTTILGFDTVKSQSKTIRKPETLIEFIKAGKPASRKFFNDLTTVSTEPSGRMNEHIIILKAW
jgi:hypothetical protein